VTQGERAFGYTLAAFVLALAIPLAFAVGLPATPLLIGILGVPPACVALVWIALRRKCSRGGVWPGRVAWAIIAVFGANCIFWGTLGGLFAVPAWWLLVNAAALTPAPR
jgi:hypothetical protein